MKKLIPPFLALMLLAGCVSGVGRVAAWNRYHQQTKPYFATCAVSYDAGAPFRYLTGTMNKYDSINEAYRVLLFPFIWTDLVGEAIFDTFWLPVDTTYWGIHKAQKSSGN